MTDHDNPTAETSLVGGRSTVTRLGGVVFRQSAPWSATTVALLRHLEREGFEHAPRIIGEGFDERGREMLTYVEGESPHPYPWDDDALPILGDMLKKLHTAAASFVPPDGALWRPWFGRDLGQPSVIGHCDTGAWNIIARDRLPVALIDWEEAGPVDPMIELAQACWLNALLFDDDLAETLGLGSVEARGRQIKLLLDGYGLPSSRRIGFVDLIRDFAIANAANELIQGDVTVETTDAAALLAAVAWRTRSAGWLVKHHDALDNIVARSS
ncbi:MAG: aminoglycoside phosphotransferase family protein [Devosia sp.]